jgi:uncharacterized protein
VLKTGEIAQRLYDLVSCEAETLVIEEIRFGLSYAGVRLSNGHVGLAALLLHELPPDCSVFPETVKFAHKKASSLLTRLTEGKNPLGKALGLATANAIVCPTPSSKVKEDDRNALAIMKLTPEDRVAMVGLFSPMVPKIEATGAKLSVIEKDPARMIIPSQSERERILRECTVAIITATTLLNDTMEDILAGLGNPRHIAILGPSTPLAPEIFQGTPVNHLGGATVVATNKIMDTITEGGLPVMRPHLRFVNLLF